MKINPCPICGGPDFELVQEEVDIGVGIQTFVTGGWCPKCEHVPFCTWCGEFSHSEDGKIEHSGWCQRDKSLDDKLKDIDDSYKVENGGLPEPARVAWEKQFPIVPLGPNNKKGEQ